MVQFCKQLAEARWFQQFITLVILFAGVLVGVETYHIERYHHAIQILDKIVLGIFILEIVVKMVAEGNRPWRYFYDPWNCFDITIVVAAILPFTAEYATVLRLLRLLRVLRLVRALPKLQLLVGALIKSVPSMGYVGMLLGMLFYVYACAGVFIFGAHDPAHFHDLPTAALTLFSVVTLEGWVDVMATQMDAAPGVAPFYFISFILVGTMVTMNLFIGVIVGGMAETQEENAEREAIERRAKNPDAIPTLDDELKRLHEELDSFKERITSIQRDHSARQLSESRRPPAA